MQIRKTTGACAAVSLATLGCLLLAAPRGIGQPSKPPVGDTERGAELFARYGCYECHLYSGAGYAGVPGGAPLVPMALSLRAFTLFLRNPSVPRRMPPYSAKELSDDQAAAVYAFITSLPAPRRAADIPELAKIIAEIEAAADR